MGFYVHKFEEVHLLFLELLTEHQMMDGPNDVKGRVGRREDKREHECCKRGLLTTQTASQQSYYSATAL